MDHFPKLSGGWIPPSPPPWIIGLNQFYGDSLSSPLDNLLKFPRTTNVTVMHGNSCHQPSRIFQLMSSVALFQWYSSSSLGLSLSSEICFIKCLIVCKLYQGSGSQTTTNPTAKKKLINFKILQNTLCCSSKFLS